MPDDKPSDRPESAKLDKVWPAEADRQIPRNEDAIDRAAKAIRANDEFLKRHSRRHPPEPAQRASR